jgi:hypothetical protein
VHAWLSHRCYDVRVQLGLRRLVPLGVYAGLNVQLVIPTTLGMTRAGKTFFFKFCWVSIVLEFLGR